MRRLIALAWLGLLVPAFASGQVTNPSGVSFDVSADHDVLVLGVPAVARYELRITAVGEATVTTFDLAKPVPVGVTATVVNAAMFAPLAMGEYVARVVAIGPGGEGVSLPTVPFGRLTAARAPTVPRVIP